MKFTEEQKATIAKNIEKHIRRKAKLELRGEFERAEEKQKEIEGVLDLLDDLGVSYSVCYCEAHNCGVASIDIDGDTYPIEPLTEKKIHICEVQRHTREMARELQEHTEREIVSGDFTEGQRVTVRIDGHTITRHVGHDRQAGDLYIVFKGKRYFYSEF